MRIFSEEWKKKLKENHWSKNPKYAYLISRMKGDQNPAKRLEVKQKMSENNGKYWLNRKNPEQSERMKKGNPNFWKNKIGKDHVSWKNRIGIVCNFCGAQIEKLPLRIHKHNFCNNECKAGFLSLTSKGENNPNWRNGSSFVPYPLGWTKTFKEQIRCRDKHKCQLCAILESICGGNLHVHHIDYNKNNLYPNNLISLCQSCHMKTNGNRDYWRGLFMDLTNRYNGKVGELTYFN